MARETIKQALAERQDAAAPYLFDEDEMPVHAAVLDSIRARHYEHRGVRLVEDEARALRLVELVMARWGVKRISREMGISTHTVRAARRLLALQGKLAPYKQRIVEAMEDAIEAGAARYRDALEAGFISAGQIPVGLGIMFDKRALAMGEATSISGTSATPDDSLRVETLNRYLESLPRARVDPSDSESIGNWEKPQQISRAETPDARPDAGAGRPSPDGETAPARAPAQEEGGGDRARSEPD